MSGKGATAAGSIPAAARRLVQSVREIVGCPDAEIYAALLECGMDADEAVSRLLTQDTFHEVKGKRDKKKEIKEIPDTRTRAISNKGGRGGGDRGGQSIYFQSPSIGYNQAPKPSILGSVYAGNTCSSTQMAPCSSNKSIVLGEASLPSQSAVGLENSWSRMTSHMSMADIVKMGRPQCKPSGNPCLIVSGPYNGQYSGLFASEVSVSVDHKAHVNGWFTVPKPPADRQLIPDASMHPRSLESTELIDDGVNFCESSQCDANGYLEPDNCKRGATLHHIESEKHQVDSAASHHDLRQNMTTFVSQRHPLDENEDNGVHSDISSAAAGFQNLSLYTKDALQSKAAEDGPALIIPDHLQISDSECAHLSFGSFTSGALAEMIPSLSTKKNVEVDGVVDNYPSVYQSDPIGQQIDEAQLNLSVDENLNSRTVTGISIEKLDVPSVSVSETISHDVHAPEAPGLKYSLSSESDQAYSSTAAPYMEHPQGDVHAQRFAPFASLLQESRLNNELAQNVPPLQDLDFSQLDANQEMATKCNSALPSASGTTNSMQEMMKPGVLPNVQSTHPSSSIATGPQAPQVTAGHPYIQPGLPPAFANLVGYPFLSPSYYLPSATFQQAYSSNGPYHPSPPPVSAPNMKYVIQQYKSNNSGSTLPQPSLQPSNYGGFGHSSNMQGNFGVNPGLASSITNLQFDELLRSQYTDASHYLALQQGDNSPLWLHGANSRTVPTPPAAPNFYGQHDPQGSYRQAQQPLPSQYGPLGYTNLYHSQAGLVQERPQNAGEVSLGGPQGALSHPIWQHSY